MLAIWILTTGGRRWFSCLVFRPLCCARMQNMIVLAVRACPGIACCSAEHTAGGPPFTRANVVPVHSCYSHLQGVYGRGHMRYTLFR